MYRAKTRTSGGKTLSKGRTAPLKPKPGLNGQPSGLVAELCSAGQTGRLPLRGQWWRGKTQGPSTSLGMTMELQTVSSEVTDRAAWGASLPTFREARKVGIRQI